NIQSESPDSDLEQLLTIDPPSLTPLESSLAPAETVASSLHAHDDDRLSTYSAGETLYDLEGYGLDILPAGAESDRQVTAAARYFALSAPLFRLLHTRARDWWLLAVDCVMGVCHRILTSKIDLDSLVESNFKVDELVQSYVATDGSQPTFRSSIDDLVFRRLFFEELENVALPYLTHVWHTADSFVYQYYSPYGSPPHPSALTTALAPCPSFCGRHQREGMMYWFVNESMRSILYYTLVKPDTAAWIGVLEIVADANLNVTISPVIGFVMEKFSFVLAWVIVEIQDLLLEQYSLCHTTLGQDRVRRVAELECRMKDFLSGILNRTNGLPPETCERARVSLLDLIQLTVLTAPSPD
ncbi:hypothetical protein PISMIDRAFT_20358, partial [Pisolithus microcarpus 441]